MNRRDFGKAVIRAWRLDPMMVSSVIFPDRLSNNDREARLIVASVLRDPERGVVKIEESFALFPRPWHWKPWRRGTLERIRLISVSRTEDDS